MSTLQDFVDIGLAEAPADLTPLVLTVLDADRAGRLDTLEGDAAAAAVTMSTAEPGRALLERFLVADPAKALDVALRVCRLHLRFAMVGGKLARVLERPSRKPSSEVPPPSFWLALRRALDTTALVHRPRARELALAADLSDLRLRAVVAFAVSYEPSLWSEAHLREVRGHLELLDPTDAGFLLFGVLRDQPWAGLATSWPPPKAGFKALPLVTLETALALVGDHKALEKLRREREVRAAVSQPGPLLERPLEADHLELLARVQPDAASLALALARLETAEGIEGLVLRTLVEGWVAGWPAEAEGARRLEGRRAAQVDALRADLGLALPATATVTSPWDSPSPGPLLPAGPPPAPPPTRGRWAAAWAPPPSAPNDAAVASVQAQLQRRSPGSVHLPANAPPEVFALLVEAWKGGRRPDQSALGAAVEAVGPALLPLAAEWTVRDPELLPLVAGIDDGHLAPSWALALGSRRRTVQESARAWVDALPRLAAEGALALLFSGDPAMRLPGLQALRRCELRAPGAVQAALAALDEAQRAWVERARAEVPSLPSKAPALSAFVHLEALPPLVSADGAARLGAAGVATVLALAKASTLDDAEALRRATSSFSAPSLCRFAGAAFVAWLSAGGAPREKWALQLLAHFPSDAWARALGGLCQGWAQTGFAVRAQDTVEVLSRMGGRVALLEVHRLATKIRTPALKAKAARAFEDAALRIGLTEEELEDRLVPDFGLTRGRRLHDDLEVDLDATLKVVLRRGAKTVKALPASAPPEAVDALAAAKKGAKQLKEAAARLERLMASGRTLSATHFAETWLMHPLLARIAERVAWAAFEGPQRVTLFLATHPTTTLAGAPFTLAESMGVRPVHVLELGPDERAALAAKALTPPFAQLDREVFTPSSFGAALRVWQGVTVGATQLIGLERAGWERGPPVDGGAYVTVTKRGPGWSAALEFEPGIYLGEPAMNPEQRLTTVAADPDEAMSAAHKSELLRDLARAFHPPWTP